MKKFLVGLLLAAASVLAARTVTLDYFFQQGCEECARVNALVLPMLAERFPGEYELRRHDISEEANYLKLVEYQERLNVTSDDAVCMIVDGRQYFGGFAVIDRDLPAAMERARQLPADSALPADVSPNRERLHRRAETFTVGAILTAGLLDGFNPCVFSTLIFFMSLLSLARIRGGRLLAAGGVYCLACFCTYVALGFGLFHVLKLFSDHQAMRLGIEIVLIALLLLFALLSFRDAWRFRRSGKSSSVTLQLPEKVKNRIHAVMRSGLKFRYLLPGAFTGGVLVTVLESVCTGQVYLPTLVLMSREFGAGSRWFGYLLLYNLMFILPLLLLFLAAWRGTSMPVFLNWSRKNVVAGKTALGCLFLLLAALMLL